MMKRKKIFYSIFIIIFIILLDQILKFAVSNGFLQIQNKFFNFTYCENTGVAFSLGDNHFNLILFFNIIIILACIIYFFSNLYKFNNKIIVSFCLIIGGGIGNIIDRIFRCFVIDYIDFSPIINFPIFNLADVCIVIGIFLLIFNILKS